jgi:hypothetical protein
MTGPAQRAAHHPKSMLRCQILLLQRNISVLCHDSMMFFQIYGFFRLTPP